MVKAALRDPVKMVYGFVTTNNVVSTGANSLPILYTKAQCQTINRELVQILTTENGEVKDNFIYQVCHFGNYIIPYLLTRMTFSSVYYSFPMNGISPGLCFGHRFLQ